MKKIIVLLFSLTCIICISEKVYGQTDHWESIFYASDTFRYATISSANLDAQNSGWREKDFDDSAWEEGPGGFGRGDGDDGTIIDRTYSVYIRKTFFIEDTSKINIALLNVDYDDGFVAFLNGKEIARSNMPTDSFPGYRSVALESHEAKMYQGGLPESFFIKREALKENLIEGNNVLAIQVHNESFASSDISAIIFLSVGIKENSFTYLNVPSWFDNMMKYFSSELPIVIIDTGGIEIPNEPRIIANMGIISDSSNSINYVYDNYNVYDGRISIELRGHSSRFLFPDGKISYGLETQDPDGNNNNVSLLGMPKENDWILYAPYSDKTLIRNALVYNTGYSLGTWSPRTRFVDVFVNGEPLGIFVLLEKIKVDKNRCDIAKLDLDDIAGDSLTGGYIVKIDWPNGVPNEGWVSPYPPNNGVNHETTFVMQYPKPVNIKTEQLDYINNYITDFETSLRDDNFKHPDEGYRQFIDFDSFIDYMLVGELFRDTDAFRCSMYMFKDKDSKGGKINMGPLWDFNYSMGNYENCEVFRTSGWAYLFNYECNTRAKINVFWYERLMEDELFRQELRLRWDELRQNQLHTDSILSFIDSTVSYIDDSQQKNFEIWPILDQYIWPNSYVGGTYENEISFLKNWLSERLLWLDENLPEVSTGILQQNKNSVLVNINTYPNPFIEQINFDYNLFEAANVRISIINSYGQEIISLVNEYQSPGRYNSEWNGEGINSAQLPKGMYFYRIYLDGNVAGHGRIVKI